MRVWPALLGLCLATAGTSCAFLLDFDELQGGPADDSGLDGQGGSDGSTVEPILFENAPHAIAQAICNRGERCAAQLMGIAYRDEDCVDLNEKTLKDTLFAKFQELPPDTVIYDGTAATLCVKALNEQPCAGPNALPDVCDDVFDGKTAKGQACVHSSQCERGAYCDVATGCPGICKARPGPNQPCAGRICASDLQCDDVGVPTCVPPVTKDKGPCLGGLYADCQLGMFCVGGSATKVGNCQPVQAAFSGGSGAACDWNDGQLCGSDYRCTLNNQEELNNQTFKGTCTEPVVAGAACVVSFPDPCPPGQYCKRPPTGLITGTCTPLPTENQDCALDSLVTAACAGKHRCIPGTPKKCAAVAQLNDPCAASLACYSGNCDTGLCAAPNFCQATD